MTQKPIDQLVADAQRAVEQQQPTPLDRYREPGASIDWSWWFTGALWLLMVGMTWTHFDDIRTAMFGVSRTENDQQMRAVLAASRDAVISWRNQNNALPDRVPLSALDALVQLQREGNTFTLTMTLNGLSATMDETGQIQFRTP